MGEDETPINRDPEAERKPITLPMATGLMDVIEAVVNRSGWTFRLLFHSGKAESWQADSGRA
jgi:hypothetical protein